VVALGKFSARFESTPVTGTTTATLAGTTFAHAWKPDDGAKTFAEKLAWPDARESVTVTQDGAGAPWVTLQSLAAIPLKAPLSSGYRITRTVTPIQQKTKDRAGDGLPRASAASPPGAGTPNAREASVGGVPWTRGDIARVTLTIEAQSDMTWVVVDDPLPAGATALGRGLGGDSGIATQGERKQGTVWPAFEERTLAAYRGYFRYVPKGTFVTEYTVRLNNPGTFNLPATRVEAMYAPEMFGEIPNVAWTVAP
jgi:uncharacterized protein YfaS (alpha-2-macroglobulin family)